jgi:hypothetical protein
MVFGDAIASPACNSTAPMRPDARRTARRDRGDARDAARSCEFSMPIGRAASSLGLHGRNCGRITLGKDARYPVRPDGNSHVSDDGHGVTMEHRHAVRHRIFWPVGLVGSNGRDAGLAANISRDGVFVRSVARFDPGGCLDLVIPRTRHDEHPVTMKALVVHRQGRGFGMMFREHSEEINAIIDRLSQPIGPR